MDCREIIKKYLRDNGYDGLCNPDCSCGCGIDDMAPCCDNIFDCVPAYLNKNYCCATCNNGWCDNKGNIDNALECYTTKKSRSK